MKLTKTLIIIFALFASSSVSASSNPKHKTLVVDQGHNQMFFINQETPLGLSKLAELFHKQGYRVLPQSETITTESLQGKDIFMTSGLFSPFSKSETNALVKYIKDGGSLLMMLHIAPPAGNLLHELGVNFSNGVIHEQEQTIENQDLNFNITNLSDHPITIGLTQFEVYGAWALMSDGNTAKVVATTGPNAWVDLDGSKTLTPGDAVQHLGVAVAGTYGNGKFIIFGDDAIFQNRFLSENNRKLMLNCLLWLTDK